MKRISILGVPVDDCTLHGASERIERFLQSDAQHQVATPNPEMILAAQHNPDFLRALQSTSLNIPDGTGILWAARHKKTPLTGRVTGTDIMIYLCGPKHGYRVFLLGAADGIAELAAKKLVADNPALQIVGTFAGSPDLHDEQGIIDSINASGAQLLFVAYGAPKQELWIVRNLSKMPRVKVAIGVGGAFDFVAGKQIRAPQSWQKIGLEWLWRFSRQPQRWRRMWNAVIVFPFTVLLSRSH